ncbi:hypothetical protein LCGC14_0390630 [marine sediment metagenome]|uniref:Uncharacterized protein n=1 Tax=marine sediment metagenome TaxID=412755 RepID=A0A0F9W8Q2_9ZZZZ
MYRRILIVIVLLCLLTGCSDVQMAPPYEQAVKASAIRVAELNKRCQAGDEVACKEGMAVASETLDLIVEALEGRYDH